MSSIQIENNEMNAINQLFSKCLLFVFLLKQHITQVCIWKNPFPLSQVFQLNRNNLAWQTLKHDNYFDQSSHDFSFSSETLKFSVSEDSRSDEVTKYFNVKQKPC